jgi:hypothetical protein
VFNACFDSVFGALRELIVVNKENEEVLLSIFSFLEKCRVPPRKLFEVEKSGAWFLFALVPLLMEFGSDERGKVRSAVSRILGVVHSNLGAILKK